MPFITKAASAQPQKFRFSRDARLPQKRNIKTKPSRKTKNCASFWFFTLLGRAVVVAVAVAAVVVAVAVFVRTSSHCQVMHVCV